jgi:hypothetical protein
MRPKSILSTFVMVMLSIIISACGSATLAQTGDVGQLPTAPPAPTYAPAAEAEIPPAPNSSQPKSGSTALAADQFDGDLNAWRVLDLRVLPGATPSEWQAKAGRLDQITGPDGMPALSPTAFLTGDASWSNYSVQAAAYSRGNSAMGLVGRASDEGMYMLVIRPASSGGGSQLMIQRYDAASETFVSLAEADTGGTDENTWYSLELSFEGTSITALINGKEVLKASDPTYSAGEAGVYAYAEGGLSFDNFSVQSR